MIRIVGGKFLLLSPHCNQSSLINTKHWKYDWSCQTVSLWWCRLVTAENFNEHISILGDSVNVQS